MLSLFLMATFFLCNNSYMHKRWRKHWFQTQRRLKFHFQESEVKVFARYILSFKDKCSVEVVNEGLQ